MKKQRTIIIAFVLSIIGELSYADYPFGQENHNNGKKLIHASNCLQCHGTEHFVNKSSGFTSLQQLESQVRMCDSKLEANFFDDEIHAAVNYLNDAYYQF